GDRKRQRRSAPAKPEALVPGQGPVVQSPGPALEARRRAGGVRGGAGTNFPKRKGRSRLRRKRSFPPLQRRRGNEGKGRGRKGKKKPPAPPRPSPACGPSHWRGFLAFRLAGASAWYSRAGSLSRCVPRGNLIVPLTASGTAGRAVRRGPRARRAGW